MANEIVSPNASPDSSGSVVVIAGRHIAQFQADIVISEEHTDSATFTSEPIELGTPVSDHAFRNASLVTLVLGWSDASDPSSGSSGSDADANGTPNVGASNYLKDIYQNMLNLKDSFTPVSLVTGKRMYTNMVVESIKETTHKETERILMLTIAMKEMIFATTSQAAIAPLQNGDPTQQANPISQAPPINTGTKQTITPTTPPELPEGAGS